MQLHHLHYEPASRTLAKARAALGATGVGREEESQGEGVREAAGQAVTLRLYDIEIDDWREPTQADLDRLVETAASYGRLRKAVTDEHVALQHRIADVMARAQFR